MYDPRSKIQELISRIANKNVDPSVIFELMGFIREYLEDNNLKSTYPLANMYCNWCVHTQISESSVGEDLILNVQSALMKHSTGSPDTLLEEVRSVIGMHILREELVSIFKAMCIDPVFFDDANWNSTRRAIFRKIADKPITFSSRSRGRRKKSLIEQRAGNEVFFDIEKFYFSVREDGKIIRWNVENPSGGKTQGDLCLY